MKPIIKTCIAALGTACAAAAWAQAASAPQPPPPPLPPQPVPIEYRSVAEALAALKAKDGNGAVVTQSEGWFIIHEPMSATQWSFTPPGHAAYPAVVRRIIQRGTGGRVSVDVAKLCEAPAAACASLQAEFEGMNERITQAVRSRSRQGSTPPQPPQ